jgi:hypothetical protein
MLRPRLDREPPDLSQEGPADFRLAFILIPLRRVQAIIVFVSTDLVPRRATGCQASFFHGANTPPALLAQAVKVPARLAWEA